MTLKLFIVLVVVPIIGNSIQVASSQQFWITDSVLKKKTFDGQSDPIIRDSYFRAKNDQDNLIVQPVNDTKKASFITDRQQASIYQDRSLNLRNPGTSADSTGDILKVKQSPGNTLPSPSQFRNNPNRLP